MKDASKDAGIPMGVITGFVMILIGLPGIYNPGYLIKNVFMMIPNLAVTLYSVFLFGAGLIVILSHAMRK